MTVVCQLTEFVIPACPVKTCWHWWEPSKGHCSLADPGAAPVDAEQGGKLLAAAVVIRDAFAVPAERGKCNFCHAPWTTFVGCPATSTCVERNVLFTSAMRSPLFQLSAGANPSRATFWHAVASVRGVAEAVHTLTGIDPETLTELTTTRRYYAS